MTTTLSQDAALRRPWTGTLARLDTVSVDRCVLARPTGGFGALPHADLPLPLLVADHGCGSITEVWEDDGAVWAHGIIAVQPDTPWGRRLLDRTPQPVDIHVVDGIHHTRRRWRGGDITVTDGWSIDHAALVEVGRWHDAFITLDDD